MSAALTLPRTEPSHEANDGPFAYISGVIAGWLMCAPLVFPGDIHAQSSVWLAAAGIAAFAVMSLYSPRLRYVNTALGLYLIGSALILPLPEAGKINSVICGALVVASSVARGRFSARRTPATRPTRPQL